MERIVGIYGRFEKDGVNFCNNQFTKHINKNYKLLIKTNVQSKAIFCTIIKK